MDGEWYSGRWKKKIIRKYIDLHPVLDIGIFNCEMLDNILQFKETDYTENIQYIPGTTTIQEFEDKTLAQQDNIGIMLYPVSIQELKEVADKRDVFPAKSTWFEPRVTNGVICLELN